MGINVIIVSVSTFIIGVLFGLLLAIFKPFAKEEEEEEEELFPHISFSTYEQRDKAQDILNREDEETQELAKQAKKLGL